MADSKLSALTAATAVTTDDLLYVVDDPSGTATSKKVTFDNLQKSITVLGGAAGVTTGGDVIIPAANYFYMGPSGSDGSWRFYISGTSLLVERRESGNWVEKSAFLA